MKSTITTRLPYCSGNYVGQIVCMGGLGRCHRWIIDAIEHGDCIYRKILDSNENESLTYLTAESR